MAESNRPSRSALHSVSSNGPPLAAYLEPQVSAARQARQREAIRRRLARPTLSVGFWAVAAAGCALLLGVVAWRSDAALWLPSSSPVASTWEPSLGAELAAKEHALQVQLSDGSRLELEPQTEIVTLPQRAANVELEVKRGRASFDVTHRQERQFRVHAGAVTVVVLGTRFSVGCEAGKVTVVVERGRVAVYQGAAVTYLEPGQRWEGEQAGERAELGAQLPSGFEEPSPVATGARAEEAPAGDTESVASAPVARSEPESELENEGAAHVGRVSPSRATAPVAGANEQGSTDVATPASNPAKELFEASREARRLGDSKRAAQLLQQLVASYPSDARAGLAAFELGRIRLDVFGEVAGAISAFEQALRLSPRAGFRQEALARLARAYDRAGRPDACKRVKQRYLSAQGEGVSAQRVLRLCP